MTRERRLHGEHAESRRERGKPEAVTTDESRRAVTFVQQEGPDPVAVLRAPGEDTLGLDSLEAHSVRSVADRVADLRVLELRKDSVDAVHVEAEQVLDPVIRVRAAARRWAHLRDPGPDGGSGGVDVDRPRRDSVGVFEQLVSSKSRTGLGIGRSPTEDRRAQEAEVHGGGHQDDREEARQLHRPVPSAKKPATSSVDRTPSGRCPTTSITTRCETPCSVIRRAASSSVSCGTAVTAGFMAVPPACWSSSGRTVEPRRDRGRTRHPTAISLRAGSRLRRRSALARPT